jgi:lipoprotein-anchoring transpeptidase ErfK/SrfK
MSLHTITRPLATLLLLAAAPLSGIERPSWAAVEPPPAISSTRAAEVPGSASVTPTPGSLPAPPARPGATPTGATPATAAVTSTRQIVLELGKRTISLVDNGKVLGSWPVAIGDPSTPTPTGQYKVRTKVVNPQYQSTKSGKNNPTIGPQGPLGDRWIGFHTTAKDEFGIHGTPSAWAWTVSSRAAVTHGCVRMLTPHVRQLFDQVQVGTSVVVKP